MSPRLFLKLRVTVGLFVVPLVAPCRSSAFASTREPWFDAWCALTRPDLVLSLLARDSLASFELRGVSCAELSLSGSRVEA